MALKIPVSSDSARKLLGTSTPASNLQIDFTFPGEIGAVYNAVMGDDRLINTGECIEIRDGNDVSIMHAFMSNYVTLQAVYGILLSCLEGARGETFCVARLFTSLSITNEYDCPILTISDSLILIPSIKVLRSVSILHLCNSDCIFLSDSSCTRSIERQLVNVSSLSFKHNFSNDLYFLNIYCMI